MNRILRNLGFALLGLAVVAGSVSCSTSKNASKSTSVQSQATGNVAAGRSDAASADRNDGTLWTSVQMPVRMSLTQPKKFAMSGRVTMLRDSVINMSMRMLGMEVAAVHITADSVWVADRFHKAVFSAGISGFLAGRNMSLAMLQGMLLGLDTQGVGPVHIKNDAGDDIVTINLSDYTDTPAGMMASVINVSAEVRNTPVELTLVWSPDRAVWNNPSTTLNFRTDFSGYRRYSLADVKRLAGDLGGGQ